MPARPPDREYAKKRRINIVRTPVLGASENRIINSEIIKIINERKIAK